MKNKISNALGFPVKLMAALTLLSAIIFNTQIANAQANTKPAEQKQTSIQQKTVQTKPATTTTMKTAQTKPITDVFNGKSYDITLTEKGKTTGEKDHLVFSEKKFESKYGAGKGFAKSDYMVTGANGVTSFHTKTTSATEGTMSWNGTLKGDNISGMATLMKPDKTMVVYSFTGKAVTNVAKTDTKSESKPGGY